MEWYAGYLLVGLIMWLGVKLDALDSKTNAELYANDLESFSSFSFALGYPASFFLMYKLGYNWNDNYVRARSKRDAQDFKLYGC